MRACIIPSKYTRNYSSLFTYTPMPVFYMWFRVVREYLAHLSTDEYDAKHNEYYAQYTSVCSFFIR